MYIYIYLSINNANEIKSFTSTGVSLEFLIPTSYFNFIYNSKSDLSTSNDQKFCVTGIFGKQTALHLPLMNSQEPNPVVLDENTNIKRTSLQRVGRVGKFVHRKLRSSSSRRCHDVNDRQRRTQIIVKENSRGKGHTTQPTNTHSDWLFPLRRP